MERYVRTSQLIAPFGPGSLYTDRNGETWIICGLDGWFGCVADGAGNIGENDVRRDEFAIGEPRLLNLLGIDLLYRPPDYRRTEGGGDRRANRDLIVPVRRFPQWYVNSDTNELRPFGPELIRLPEGKWKVVRFIAVCANGHIQDFPWKEWAGCKCDGYAGLKLIDKGGAGLDSIVVYCSDCEQGRSLAGVTAIPDEGEDSSLGKQGIRCRGERPWLGDSEAGCESQLVGALINQTNLHFARIASAIGLPPPEPISDAARKICGLLREDTTIEVVARVGWRSGSKEEAIRVLRLALQDRIKDATEDDFRQALEKYFDGDRQILSEGDAILPGEPERLAFRRAEYLVLREAVDREDLKVREVAVPAELNGALARVRVVDRLRETRAFYGFDRLRPGENTLDGMPGTALRQLFRRPPQQGQTWLPAVVVHGEGIWIELDEGAIRRWLEAHGKWLKGRFSRGNFVDNLRDAARELRPAAGPDWRWCARFLLVHSLAHVLIRELVYESGYSAASLRERLYVAGGERPMAAILIYTGSGDSEGSLGGLAQCGMPSRLGTVFRSALFRASWCSADPVCSENVGPKGPRRANLAACHACILLPETSCELTNDGLDRAMLVGTPEKREAGFFSSLLEGVVSVG